MDGLETRVGKQYGQASLYKENATVGHFRPCCAPLKSLIMSDVQLKSQRSSRVGVKTCSLSDATQINLFRRQFVSPEHHSSDRAAHHDYEEKRESAPRCDLCYPSQYTLLSLFPHYALKARLRGWVSIEGSSGRHFWLFRSVGGMSMLVILIPRVKEWVLEHSNSQRDWWVWSRNWLLGVLSSRP